jgi:transposase-like protein
MEPGMNVSMSPACMVSSPALFKWKKQYQEGSLTAVAAGEEVVPASELIAVWKQVRSFQRLLGKKMMEVEILKEAVEYGQSRKMDSARALVAKGRGIAMVSRTMGVSRAQLSLRINRSADWQDRRCNHVMKKQTQKHCRLSSTLSAICRVMVIDACGASCASNVAQRDSPCERQTALQDVEREPVVAASQTRADQREHKGKIAAAKAICAGVQMASSSAATTAKNCG